MDGFGTSPTASLEYVVRSLIEACIGDDGEGKPGRLIDVSRKLATEQEHSSKNTGKGRIRTGQNVNTRKQQVQLVMLSTSGLRKILILSRMDRTRDARRG